MKLTAIVIVCLLAVACNPKLYTPQVDVPEHYLHAGEFTQESISAEWWQAFGDPILDALIDTALLHNRNLAVAASRVEQARYNMGVVRAQFLPELSLGISAEGERAEESGIGQKYSVQPMMTWEISLFGALRNTKRSAWATILSSEWTARSVMLSLVSEVATTYFTYRQYQRNLYIARNSYTLRVESTALIDSMFRYGMSNGVDLNQSRSLVYTAAADISVYERALEQTRLSLNVLLGQTPDYIAPNISDSTLKIPDIPAGVPSDLLERRPDVMESFYSMQQASARVGIARAERYPSIALTASGGAVGGSLKALTSGDPLVWSALVSLAQPLFAFGKLKRQEQAAREVYKQSLYTYEQSVLAAMADVESSLLSISTYRQQSFEQTKLVEAGKRIAQMTNALYKSGLSDYLDVIDAERNIYQAQMQQVNLAAQQYINYVNLYKALGGGF